MSNETKKDEVEPVRSHVDISSIFGGDNKYLNKLKPEPELKPESELELKKKINELNEIIESLTGGFLLKFKTDEITFTPHVLRVVKEDNKYIVKILEFNNDNLKPLKVVNAIIGNSIKVVEHYWKSEIDKYHELLSEDRDVDDLKGKLTKTYPEGIPKILNVKETDEQIFSRLRGEGVKFYKDSKKMPPGEDGDKARKLKRVNDRIQYKNKTLKTIPEKTEKVYLPGSQIELLPSKPFSHLLSDVGLFSSQSSSSPGFELEIIGYQSQTFFLPKFEFELEVVGYDERNVNLLPPPLESKTLSCLDDINYEEHEWSIMNFLGKVQIDAQSLENGDWELINRLYDGIVNIGCTHRTDVHNRLYSDLNDIYKISNHGPHFKQVRS